MNKKNYTTCNTLLLLPKRPYDPPLHVPGSHDPWTNHRIRAIWTYIHIYNFFNPLITSRMNKKNIRRVTLYFCYQNDPMTLPYTYLGRMTPGPTIVFELFGLISTYIHFSIL